MTLRKGRELYRKLRLGTNCNSGLFLIENMHLSISALFMMDFSLKGFQLFQGTVEFCVSTALPPYLLISMCPRLS